MFRFLVTFCCFFLLVESKEQNPSDAEKIRSLFDKVIKNQKHIQAMISSNIETKQEQTAKELQKFLPGTELLLHDILQRYRKLTISMRDQFQRQANQLEPLINQEYDIQQLEIQRNVRDFLQTVLDSISYHTKHCLAYTRTDESIISNQCEQQQQWPASCKDVLPKKDGVARIYFQEKSYFVFCNQNTMDGGWMLILNRTSPEKNFQNTWVHYKEGFGTFCEKDFFAGLHLMHQLTAARKHELLIEVINNENKMAYAYYDEVLIGDELTGYQLMKLGIYSGTAGDSLRYAVGRKFATIENDIDDCVQKYNATGWLMGGDECSVGNIFGNIFIIDKKAKNAPKKQSSLTWPSFEPMIPLKEVRVSMRAV